MVINQKKKWMREYFGQGMDKESYEEEGTSSPSSSTSSTQFETRKEDRSRDAHDPHGAFKGI
jgi:hypothetical protein